MITAQNIDGSGSGTKQEFDCRTNGSSFCWTEKAHHSSRQTGVATTVRVLFRSNLRHHEVFQVHCVNPQSSLRTKFGDPSITNPLVSRAPRITMSGLEVVAAVAAVVSAFHGGAELLKHIRTKRRQARQPRQEFEEDQLQVSLETGGKEITVRNVPVRTACETHIDFVHLPPALLRPKYAAIRGHHACRRRCSTRTTTAHHNHHARGGHQELAIGCAERDCCLESDLTT